MYYFNEGSLELPEAWRDMTVNVLTSSLDETVGLSFTLSRDTPPWGMGFHEFSDREIDSLSRQLNHYQLLGKHAGEVNHHPSVTAEFCWSSEQGRIHQLMTLVDIAPRVLILTATMVGELTPQQKEHITATVQTLQIRERP